MCLTCVLVVLQLPHDNARLEMLNKYASRLMSDESKDVADAAAAVSDKPQLS